MPETAATTHRWKWKYENEFKWFNHINGEQRKRQEESLIKSCDWRLFVQLRQDAINTLSTPGYLGIAIKEYMMNIKFIIWHN